MVGKVNNNVVIRRFEDNDLGGVVKVHRDCFPYDNKNKTLATEWVLCNSRAYPRNQYFLAESNKGVIGYVLYMAKGGFSGGNPKNMAVVELEQIGVLSDFRGRNVGTKLAKESFKDLILDYRNRNLEIKSLLVTTSTSNNAQRFYRKVFGAEVVAVVPQLYSGDEAIMLARFNEKKLNKFLKERD